jgi:UDP-glucuronate decarboxylase
MQSSEAGPINLGNPKEFTMLELAKKIITKTNSQSEIIFEPLPVDDPRQRQPDISKANKILNWNPLIQLDRGLDLTIDYFRTCK